MATASILKSGLPDPTVHITTHNSDGKATLYSASPSQWSWVDEFGVGLNAVYTTSTFPVSMNNNADIESHEATIASAKLGLVQKNGTVCRIVDYAPESPPHMHRTQSLDYGVVLSGEMVMELEDGSETKLKPGDVVVQRGTNHSWHNPSKTMWSRMLFVLQHSEPVIVDGKRLREEIGSADKHIPRSGNDE
ncbi:uncharacterized protein A1O9_09052 [Exophiala aquamarina CBS 119918]|uniref:Cupin type-2 domain-containing protein n=1 Tax=Exophiala aquamarina CBS 119918 TaxID=1182545 RepID=A0A072PGC1_9EURO|nr:uncharacterized protein A1O9_09052 [Exophiala aquamarina CBS 119918]KEF54610.1 hypothetical protein A1O9_09052 [Exophiala aquamarina CBS 119918]